MFELGSLCFRSVDQLEENGLLLGLELLLVATGITSQSKSLAFGSEQLPQMVLKSNGIPISAERMLIIVDDDEVPPNGAPVKGAGMGAARLNYG